MGGGGKKPASPKKAKAESSEDARMAKPSSTSKSPRETCPSFARGHLPSEEQAERYRAVSAPHVESFDYFLTTGLRAAVSDVVPNELDVVDPREKREMGAASAVKEDVDCVRFWVENARISLPSKIAISGGAARLTPRECREMAMTYAGGMTADFCYQFIDRRADGSEVEGKVSRCNKRFGDMPIMTMSRACHLRGKSPEKLVRMKEEHNEFGGYFIVNGIERCVRILQIPRRNHPTAIQRGSYKKRGPTYTDLGVAVRSARHCGDCSSITNTVHYLTTGGASLRFPARKQEFLIPVVLLLRALSGGDDAALPKQGGGGVTDEELYRRIVRGDSTNTFLRARAELLLQDARRFSDLADPSECLAYLGARFRMLSGRADSTSDVDVGRYMIDRFVLIHLPNHSDKLEYLLLLLRKLYSFAAGECGVDNADSFQNQEILLPGHLICHYVKEKFEESLQSVRLGLLKEMRVDFARAYSSVKDSRWWSRMVDRYAGIGGNASSIGKKVQHFLSTGNIVSSTGLDLMQVSGYTIIAERLNFLRYCAHFRSVHRGQFFMEMRTTAVRKLLPDQWGFLCPVHTPDGGPCGLLSHLALKCEVMSYPAETMGGKLQDLDELLIGMGVTPCGTGGAGGDGRGTPDRGHLPVCLDGRVVGGAPARLCKSIAIHLRELKVAEPEPIVPPTLEVAHIPSTGSDGEPYPGLYLFTGSARVVRPVLHRRTGRTERIGPMEQPFMDIACLREDVREGITTHMELDPNNMLSLIASLTPFSDYNQSPRNMYQCQMGKQTMGTPVHSLPYRPDNKLYRLQNPQAPVVQTARHGAFNMDEYPNGTNAVVAVLSYTGFDMEDAMILNKSSYERGFGHASVYKTMTVDLRDKAEHMGAKGGGCDGSGEARLKFSNILKKPEKKKKKREGEEEAGEEEKKVEKNAAPWLHRTLDEDGLPMPGEWVSEGDALYCVVDTLTGKDNVGRHKEKEKACVQCVRKLGSASAGQSMNSKSGGRGSSSAVPDEKISLTLRFPRNPVIGDKFSSRHGQKGVMSILWPQVDMPFSESGISPDVIINPHAFPSRMTIGMLIESMAGKAGALHGIYQDATPFSFHETSDKLAVDYFGEQLQAAGYSYYGSEPLYSGVSGCIMQADLYLGVVYYQRLRHMVSDKYQVRATGSVNAVTRQPIKGRKQGGGVRLGEMERDSLLSHGAAFLLLDRLVNCSDRHVARACRRCGDLLGPATERSSVLSAGQSAAEATNRARLRVYCRNPRCREATAEGADDDAVEPIALPYVFRYLANELAGMNIKMTLDIK